MISSSSSPARYRCSQSEFSTKYEQTMWVICLVPRKRPSPKFTSPTLLLTTVKSFTRVLSSAPIRFSGIAQKPKPRIMILAPSGMSLTASTGSA